MQELHPRPRAVDDVFAELAADRPPVPSDRPWVTANMIASVDGAFAVDGRSGGLGTEEDRDVFHALRGLADVILVGAATARDERYRRPSPLPVAAAERGRRGQGPAARLVLVSRSGRLPADQPFLEGDGEPPLLVHPSSAAVDAPAGVETLACGHGSDVDVAALLRHLHGEGARRVLSEGGPGLLGQLHRGGLLDELFVTTSPLLVGGRDVGLLGHGPALPTSRHLHRLWLGSGGALFATWRC